MTEESESSLSKVVVPIKTITLRSKDGEQLEVRPFKFGQLSKVLKHVGTLMAYADELGDIDIVAAFQGASDEVFELLCLSLKKPAEYFDDLEMDEGFSLAVAMVEVNQDFFVHQVLPLIRDYLPNVADEVETVAAVTADETPTPLLTETESSSTETEDPSAPDGVPLDVIPLEMRTTGLA